MHRGVPSLVVFILIFLLKQVHTPQTHILAEMGLLTGFAALFRFNMAALLFIGIWVAFCTKNSQLFLAEMFCTHSLRGGRSLSVVDSQPHCFSREGPLFHVERT